MILQPWSIWYYTKGRKIPCYACYHDIVYIFFFFPHANSGCYRLHYMPGLMTGIRANSNTATATYLLKCIWIAWGIIRTKTSGGFLEGFFIVEGQFH